MNHQLNRLTGGTGITRSRHLSASLNIIAQIILDSVSLRLNSITAKRAFRGMAGLAVLYPSVVDYIGQAIKDALSALYGDLGGYPVNLRR